MATWTTPKTDWKGTDYFTATDWLRISNNVKWLADLYQSQFPFTPKTDVTDGVTVLTAADRNEVVKVIEGIYDWEHISVNRGMVLPRKDYGSAWNSEDLNNIETMIYNIHEVVYQRMARVELYAGEFYCFSGVGNELSTGLL